MRRFLALLLLALSTVTLLPGDAAAFGGCDEAAMTSDMPMDDVASIAPMHPAGSRGQDQSTRCPETDTALICPSMGPCVLSAGLPSATPRTPAAVKRVLSRIAISFSPLSREATPEPPPPRR